MLRTRAPRGRKRRGGAMQSPIHAPSAPAAAGTGWSGRQPILLCPSRRGGGRTLTRSWRARGTCPCTSGGSQRTAATLCPSDALPAAVCCPELPGSLARFTRSRTKYPPPQRLRMPRDTLQRTPRLLAQSRGPFWSPAEHDGAGVAVVAPDPRVAPPWVPRPQAGVTQRRRLARRCSRGLCICRLCPRLLCIPTRPE